MNLIGKVTGFEDRASEVIAYFESCKSDLATRTAGAAEKPGAYLGCLSMRGSHGIESTTGDYVLFDVLGAVYMVTKAGINVYAMLDKEKLLEINPENIIIDAGGFTVLQEDYAANPEFYNALSAFKTGDLYLQMPYSYYAANLEIALADAYYIGCVLYPEQFSDINPTVKFDEISEFLLGISTYDRISESFFGEYQNITFKN